MEHWHRQPHLAGSSRTAAIKTELHALALFVLYLKIDPLTRSIDRYLCWHLSLRPVGADADIQVRSRIAENRHGHTPAHFAVCWVDAQTHAAFGAGSRRAGLLHDMLTARRGVTSF